MSERFRGELLRMGRYTNPAFLYLFTFLLLLLLFFLLQRLKYELQQERWSPIPSLRHCRPRSYPPTSLERSESQLHPNPISYGTCLKPLVDGDDVVEMFGYLPFRMHAAVPQFTRPVDVRRASRRPRLLCARRLPGPRRHAVDEFYRRQNMLRTLRKRTAELSKALPTFTEVNRIDRLSRLVFPSLFILFNAAYWSFYSVR